MRDIEKLIFYRTGEVVRDLGLVYFYKILDEIKEKYNLDIENRLTSNYLIFDYVDYKLISKYIIEQKIYKELKKDYFPYSRNNSKYGGNTDKENVLNNFNELIRIVLALNLKSDDEQNIILKKFEVTDRKCSVCHTYKTTIKDITHKTNDEIRSVSSLEYMFMGSRNNEFNNYNKSEEVCFVCEFFNLMVLLYVGIYNPKFIAEVCDLVYLDYINYKLLLKANQLNEKGLYANLMRKRNLNIKLFEIATHKKSKTKMIKFAKNMDYQDLLRQIQLFNLVDRFRFSNADRKESEINKIREISKRFIGYCNIKALRKILLGELLYIEKKGNKRDLNKKYSVDNINLYLEFIKSLFGREKIKLKDIGFEKLGIALGNKIAKESKKTIAFKINQMLKSDNRQGLFQVFSHLIVVNELSMPKDFAGIVIYGNEDRLHYNVGKFLEKFLIINKEEEK